MSKFKLGDIAEIQSGPFGTQLHKEEYVKFGIPMLNSKNIGNGNILTDSLDYVPLTVCERLSRYILHEGDKSSLLTASCVAPWARVSLRVSKYECSIKDATYSNVSLEHCRPQNPVDRIELLTNSSISLFR